MTSFVPKIQTGNTQEFLGYSRSPSYWQIAGSEDKSSATGLAGLGNIIGEGSKAFVAAKTSDIRDDIEKAVTPVRDAAGASLTAGDYDAMTSHPDAANDPNSLTPATPLPGPLQSGLDGINKLKAASDGNIRPGSSSHYYAQANTIVKQLKSQYPGFSDIVDREMEKFTGFNAANALRTSAMKDLAWMAEKQGTAQNKLQTEYDKRSAELQILHGGQLGFDQYSKDPQKYNLEADTYKGEVMQVQNAKAKLEYDAANGKASSASAVQTYTDEGNLLMSTTFKAGMSQLQAQGQSLLTQGANLKPQDWAQFITNLQGLKQQVQQRLDNLAVTAKDSGHSYSSIIQDRSKLVAAQQNIMAPFAALEAAAGAKDVNMMNIAGNLATMQTNADYNRVTAQMPSIRAFAAITKGLGPQLSAQVYQATGGALLPDLTKAVTDTAWLSVAAAGSDGKAPPSITDQVNNVLQTHPHNTGGAVRATVQSNVALLGATDPKIAGAAATALFSDYNFFSKIAANEQPKVYQLLASKTKEIMALNDPQTMQKYTNWLTFFAPAVAKQAIGDLQSASTYKGYTLEFDPKTMMFAASTNPEYQQQIMRGDRNHNEAAQAVYAVNNLGKTLAPVLRAQYGDQAPQQFLKVLEANGYDPSAPKTGGALETLGNAVVKALQKVGGAFQGPGDEPALQQQIEIQKGKTSGQQSLNDVPGAPTGLTQRWKYAYDSFTKNGWTPEQSAGIIGSLAGETATLNPTQSHDGGIGLGIAGWNKERLAGLKAFAKEQKGDYKDVDVQLAFVNHELNTTEKAAGDRIRQAKSPEEAAAIFTHLYERPSIPNTAARMGNATGFFRQYASK